MEQEKEEYAKLLAKRAELAVKIIKILVCAAATSMWRTTMFSGAFIITGAKFKIAFIPLFTSNSATSCAWFPCKKRFGVYIRSRQTARRLR